MSQSINVNDVIKRLQDVMAKDNQQLKEAIGGAVDLDIVLDNTSIAPMSFFVAYVGSAPSEQFVNSNTLITLSKQFQIFVVLDVEKFNGRSPQSLVPIIEEQLVYALWCWDYDINENPRTHNTMILLGDNVEYMDRGRYVHSFRFSIDYTIQYSNINDEIFADDIGYFDTFIGSFQTGEDTEGNPNSVPVEIYNIYNEGEPLN